jgi:hypothetical protein
MVVEWMDPRGLLKACDENMAKPTRIKYIWDELIVITQLLCMCYFVDYLWVS